MKKDNSLFSITFEWNSLVKDLIRNSWAIVLAALIAWLGINVFQKSVYTPSYTSSAVLVIRSKSGTAGAYSNLSASSEMATIFTKVFQQASVKRLAAENLGLERFEGSVHAEVNGKTNLMNVSVKSGDPELSFRLLNSVLEVYPEVSEAVFTDAVIDVLSSPQMPSAPSNLPVITYKNQIILLTMLLEAGLIVVFSLMRETVKEEKGFSNKIDSKLIGIVSHEKAHLSLKERFNKKKRAMLINDAYSSLKFTEDYQKLATKLEYMKKNNGISSFAVTSVAENEGKSTVCANLALALAGRGYRVALLDLDLKKPSMYKIFDFGNAMGNEFYDVLSNKIQLKDFTFYRRKKSNLIIAFNRENHENSEEIIGSGVLEKCLDVLREKTDFIIMDTPPMSATSDSVAVSQTADTTLLVIRTDCVPVRDINDAILTVSDSGGKLAGCILNDVYKPFTLFGQMGTDETGYYGYSSYGRGYSKYSASPYQEATGAGEAGDSK